MRLWEYCSVRRAVLALYNRTLCARSDVECTCESWVCHWVAGGLLLLLSGVMGLCICLIQQLELVAGLNRYPLSAGVSLGSDGAIPSTFRRDDGTTCIHEQNTEYIVQLITGAIPVERAAVQNLTVREQRASTRREQQAARAEQDQRAQRQSK